MDRRHRCHRWSRFRLGSDGDGRAVGGARARADRVESAFVVHRCRTAGAAAVGNGRRRLRAARRAHDRVDGEADLGLGRRSGGHRRRRPVIRLVLFHHAERRRRLESVEVHVDEDGAGVNRNHSGSC